MPNEVYWHDSKLLLERREALLGQKGCVLWFTGLSGSGKSTAAFALEARLLEKGRLAFVLDGDNVRHGLNSDLGFSAEDRSENIRRVAHAAALFADAGLVAVVSFISPYRSDREAARSVIGANRFFEIHFATPMTVCESRDPKGLYKKARAGLLTGFTGIDDPYEAPKTPDAVLDCSETDPDGCSAVLDGFLSSKQIFTGSSRKMPDGTARRD